MKEKELYYNLIQSLRLVASPSETQISSLPEFVHVPDEIALTYNNAYLIAPRLLNEKMISLKAYEMLKFLDVLFEKMSDDKSLWTNEKLERSELWGKARIMACTILDEMKEPYVAPDLDFIRWTK